MEFLSNTGRRLEAFNVALASRIQNCEIGGDDLDGFMVITEQSVVERALQSERADDAARFHTLVAQLNRVLQLTGHWLCASKYSYASVLASVRGELRRPVDFASTQDRVCIGRRLISHLRV
ncbi:MAG TPA: hypothetical protein VGC34_12865 [Steroidobacteraceae bacterium]